MKYRTAIAAACLSFALALAPARAQNYPYSLIDLGRLPGAYTTVVWGMNNSGQVVGWCQGPGVQVRAFLWTPGAGMTELPGVPGAIWNIAYDISDNGIVVGASQMTMTSPSTPWRYMNGSLQVLPILPGSCTSAIPRAVNNDGWVVGYTCNGTLSPLHGFLYSDETGLIELTPGTSSTALDINNAGQVTGSVASPNVGHYFRWSQASGLDIRPALSGQCADSGSAINESGQIAAGNSCSGPSSAPLGAQVYIDTPGGGVFHITPLAGDGEHKLGLNNLGHVVSSIHASPDRPWLYTPQRGQEYLDTQIDLALGYSMSNALFINDNGWIVGYATNPNPLDGFPSAIMLVPVAVNIVSANPPAASPYVSGQPFRDVLQTGDGTALTQGIGAGGTPDQDAVSYAQISVTFSGTPTSAPAIGNIAIACTNVSGTVDCPSISAVGGIGSGPYLITLSGAIPPRECTTFTFVGTNAGQKLQYQSLPGDLNLDGTSNTQDLLSLVQAINNGSANAPSNWARYNVDRSTQATTRVNTQDLLREVQLLNGINTTQAFNGATVAPCATF